MSFFILYFFIAACSSSTLKGSNTGPSWSCPENSWPTAQPLVHAEEFGYATGQIPPDIRFIDQHEDEICLWQFYGRLVLINVSAQWSGTIQGFAENTQSLQDDYGEQGLVYLTILAENSQSELPTQSNIDDWVENFGIESAPVVRPTQDIRSELVPEGVYPTLLLLNRELKIIETDITPLEDSHIRARIEDAL